MSSIEANGKTYETDEEGYLAERVGEKQLSVVSGLQPGLPDLQTTKPAN